MVSLCRECATRPPRRPRRQTAALAPTTSRAAGDPTRRLQKGAARACGEARVGHRASVARPALADRRRRGDPSPARRPSLLVQPDLEEMVQVLAADSLGQRDEVAGRHVAATMVARTRSGVSRRTSSSPTFSRSACSVIAPRSYTGVENSTDGSGRAAGAGNQRSWPSGESSGVAYRSSKNYLRACRRRDAPTRSTPTRSRSPRSARCPASWRAQTESPNHWWASLVDDRRAVRGTHP